MSLNDVDRTTRTAFVTVWQLDAWPRWRWEVNCLQEAFTPGVGSPAGSVTLPAGSVTLPAGAVGSAGSTVRLGAVQDPAEDATTHPAFSLVYQAAVARGADDALARQIAIQVVTEERLEDFLNGTHQDVLYGEHECTVRSTACPLVLTLEEYGDSTSSAPRSSPHMVSSGASGTSGSSPGRFAGYHMPNCGADGWCYVDPEWPVLEYRNGQYFRCKGLSPEGWGVGCVPY